MPLFSQNVPESCWIPCECKVGQPQGLNTVSYHRVLNAGQGQTGKISLNISHEDRNTSLAEHFSHNSQGHGFAGPCCTCNEAVSVGHSCEQGNFILRLGEGQ